MELIEAISLYMDYCSGRQLRNKTQESYKQTLRLFAAWLINEQQISEVRDISERHIRLYTSWLRNRGKYTFSYSADTELSNIPSHRRDYNQSITITTVNNYLRNLRSFFVWLVDEEVIETSPMRKVKLIPNTRVAKNYLEDDEVRRLIASMRRSVFYEYRDLIAMMVMLLHHNDPNWQAVFVPLIAYSLSAFRFAAKGLFGVSSKRRKAPLEDGRTDLGELT